jgi:predicted alpha/beta-fold hydrolase
MTKGAHIGRHFHFGALALFFLSGGAPSLGLTVVESFSASTTRKPPTTTSPTTQERELRIFQSQVSGPLANSFEPSTFNPFPLLSNPHLQTIVATLLRNIPEINYLYSIPHTLGGIVSSSLENNNKNNNKNFWNARERFDTPDGDFFDVDYKLHSQQQQQQQKGWVVLCHGLESNSHSNLSRDMALSYYNKGLNVACLNFRGCTDEPNLRLGGYHLGFTDDLLFFLEHLNSRNAQPPPVYLSGFSLGANVILKALGELKLQAVTKYNIQGATAFCVPYCAERNAPFLGRPGFNRVVYCGNLLSTLKQRAQRQLNQHCNGNSRTEKFDYPGVVQAKTITDFDQAFVARVYGFESAIDYYRKTSCIRFLPDIAVPTFILTAEDDPFMDPTLFPIETTIEGGGPAPIKMVKMKNGGHCGFVFHQVKDKEHVLETSWSSTEMARFLEHLMTALRDDGGGDMERQQEEDE